MSTKEAESPKKKRKWGYPIFWIIWWILLFGFIDQVLNNPDFAESDVTTFYKLLLIGLLVWLRRRGYLFKKTTTKRFIIGIVLLFVPFGWLFSLIVWFASDNLSLKNKDEA